MKTTKEMIEVMQAFLEGKTIEFKTKKSEPWMPIEPSIPPTWNWYLCDYRVKPEPKGPKYRPYENTDEMIIDNDNRFLNGLRPLYVMPIITVREKDSDGYCCALVTSISDKCVWIGGATTGADMEDMFKYFTYADGTPFGKLVEE